MRKTPYCTAEDAADRWERGMLRSGRPVTPQMKAKYLLFMHYFTRVFVSQSGRRRRRKERK